MGDYNFGNRRDVELGALIAASSKEADCKSQEGVMDVGAWLHGLGLQRYSAALESHHVDAQTLPALTEADLQDIGVKSIGHRRKLLQAIAGLRIEDDPITASESKPRSAMALGAERRQLTVVYCDMVDSTALSQRLDAEDYRTLIQRFYRACQQQVAHYDGWMANFIGDCVLVYFGWPRAHEDDAERAVRCGLSMVQAVQELDMPGDVSVVVRVGMATGAVVVGDLFREGPAQEQSAVGVTPNLAARLQALAAPGQVVMDASTASLLGSSFDVRRLGQHGLKGLREPVVVHAVNAERPADSRFDARSGSQLAPMVGRDQELALLLERWTQAQGGEGQAILLSGDAGIGKSRLIRALLDACASESHEQVRWQCSPHHTGDALWPVIQHLVRRTKLDGQESTDIERLLERAEQRPVLLVVEDAHWADPSTMELLDRCLERIRTTRLLIVITSRPVNPPTLAAHLNVTRLSLTRLNRTSVQTIMKRLGGDKLLPQTLTNIATRTEGVPLFVEELTKAVVKTGEEAIPASLRGSLIAPLDCFPEAREVAQTAACIGRKFDLPLLQMAVERPEAVAAALDKLVAAGLVYRCGRSATFAFKHTLVRQAAYESLLRSRRQRLHARILKALRSNRPDTSSKVLAHHAKAAGLCAQAVGHRQQAVGKPSKTPPQEKQQPTLVTPSSW